MIINNTRNMKKTKIISEIVFSLRFSETISSKMLNTYFTSKKLYGSKLEEILIFSRQSIIVCN